MRPNTCGLPDTSGTTQIVHVPNTREGSGSKEVVYMELGPEFPRSDSRRLETPNKLCGGYVRLQTPKVVQSSAAKLPWRLVEPSRLHHCPHQNSKAPQMPYIIPMRSPYVTNMNPAYSTPQTSCRSRKDH